MTDEQASDWEYKIICCLGISTSNSDINVVGLHKTVTELYEQGRADEREAQVCCGDYEKCMKACTPRGRWLAEKELAKPEQEFYPDWNMIQPYHERIKELETALAQPRKPWVGLTQEEVQEIAKQLRDDAAYCSTHFAIAIEAELRRKNNAV